MNSHLTTVALLLASVTSICHSQPSEKKLVQAKTSNKLPNILLILADDLGWKDVGYHGSEITTPNIDRIARQGIELDRFYAQPSCSPTRNGVDDGEISPTAWFEYTHWQESEGRHTAGRKALTAVSKAFRLQKHPDRKMASGGTYNTLLASKIAGLTIFMAT